MRTPPAPIVGRFVAHAARAPDRIAVCHGSEMVSYGDLYRRSCRLARLLSRRGVGRGDLVGLCARPSADLIVAILAILQAGGAYVPLDPAYPPARLDYLITDAGLRHAVTDACVPVVEKLVTGVTRLDDAEGEIRSVPACAPDAVAGPDDPAYVIYTSGTTGAPKGVLIPHSNVTRLFTQTERWFGFTDRDVWTLFHSYAFDFSVWEMWGALAYGGRLVVVAPETSRSPEEFHRLLLTERVTVLNQTPSAFASLIDADVRLGTAASSELSLRYVIFGGEALNPAMLRPWVERHGTARPQLVNMYGITETTVHVTRHLITEAEVSRGAGAIGVPIPDLRVELLDDQGTPVPQGAVGEIFVGGAGVAAGYLNRPDLTAARFIEVGGQRMYRTGDLGRWRSDGELEFCGRRDDQLKIRGFRIEPGEVEAALATHPLVRQAAVVARQDTHGRAFLAAYLTCADPKPGTAELVSHLRRAVPAHLIPRTFRVLRALPLTPNGKIDRHRLSADLPAEGDRAS